ENATVLMFGDEISIPPFFPGTPAVAVVPPNSSFLPRPSTSGDTVGWLYLNLNNGGSKSYSVARTPEGATRIFARGLTAVRQSQNRSEEHTSELQSLRHLVCRLLLEKKKEK